MVTDLKSVGCHSPRGSNPLLSAILFRATDATIGSALVFLFHVIADLSYGLIPEFLRFFDGYHVHAFVAM